MQNLYRQIFFTTTKYVFLRNFFMVITGIVSIFIVRLLGPEEYGKYALVWQLIGTIGPILSLGWHATLAKFLPEKDEQEKKILFSQSVLSVAVLCLLFLLIGYIIIQFLPQIIPAEIKQIKTLFLFFISFVAFFNVFEGFYRGLGKFNQWSIIDGMRSNLGNLLGLIFLILGFRIYKSIIYSNFAVAFIFLVVVAFSLRNYFFFTKNKVEKVVLKFALTMFLGQIVYLFMSSIDSVMLRSILKDPSKVGIYNAGIRIPKIIETMFIAVLSTPFLYYFSSPGFAEQRLKILEFSSRILFIFFGFVSLLLFVFSKYIIFILFGNIYSESIITLQLSSLGLSLLAYLILFSVYFMSINKPEIGTFLGIAYFLIVGMLNLLFIPMFKSYGPAVSNLIALVVYCILILVIVKKLEFFKKFLLVGLCIFISVMFGYIFNHLLSPAIYLLLIILFNVITFEEGKKVWEIIIRKV